jgi:hypothetical protein
MAKKLIITEEQYDRIHKLILESAEIESTLRQAKVGDVLSFKGINSILKVKVTDVDQSNGEIVGQTENGDKVSFNVNSFNQATKMLDFKIFNTQKNKVIDTPFQLDSVDNIGSEDIQTDEPEHGLNDTEENPNQENGYKYIAGTVYNGLVNDKELKKLMQHTSWWDSFVAELTGKKAEGKGILNALKFYSRFENEKLIKKLGDGFVTNQWAEFQVLEPVTIYYNIGDKEQVLNFNVGSTYIARNQAFNLKEKDYRYRVLKGKGVNAYKIYVKDKTEEQDVFICNITQGFNDSTGEWKKITEENVRIKFLDSAVYKPTNNQ